MEPFISQFVAMTMIIHYISPALENRGNPFKFTEGTVEDILTKQFMQGRVGCTEIFLS